MADPICRWRNPNLLTVIELISILPKEEMTKIQARQIVIANSPYNAPFYKTPYQLACQLGLYHETNDRYFPKFTFIPTEHEILSYLKNWIIHYCVPNPYTNGFDNLEPRSIHSEICRILLENENSVEWEIIQNEIFQDEIGNSDILKNSINFYSPIIQIENQIVRLKDNKTYEELNQYIDIDININRDDKEYFFDLFSIQNTFVNNNGVSVNQELINEVNPQDIVLINEVKNLPHLTQTEKNQIVAARIGQGYFRRNLILECGFCPITLIDESKLLIASHIKPWRNSDNLERINPKNGILLTPTFDKLFDKGIISFTNDKALLVSNSISQENKQKLNIINGTVYPQLPINGREQFLEFHRDVVFKG